MTKHSDWAQSSAADSPPNLAVERTSDSARNPDSRGTPLVPRRRRETGSEWDSHAGIRFWMMI